VFPAAGFRDDLLHRRAHGVVLDDVHNDRPDAAMGELLEAVGAAGGRGSTAWGRGYA
jgi:hypothetical protein